MSLPTEENRDELDREDLRQVWGGQADGWDDDEQRQAAGDDGDGEAGPANSSARIDTAAHYRQAFAVAAADLGRSFSIAVTGSLDAGGAMSPRVVMEGPNGERQTHDLDAANDSFIFTPAAAGSWTIDISDDAGAGTLSVAIDDAGDDDTTAPPQPAYASNYPVAVPEDTAVGTVLGTLSATTPTRPAAQYSYTLVDGPSHPADGPLEITAAGELRLKSALDYADSIFHVAMVRVSDELGNHSDFAIVVDVTDIKGDVEPGNIKWTTSFAAGVPETTAPGTEIGRVTASDPDGDDARLSYSFVIDDQGNTLGFVGPYHISPDGRITLESPVDATQNAHYDLKVRVMDPDGYFTYQDIRIASEQVNSQLRAATTAPKGLEDAALNLGLSATLGGEAFDRVVATPGAGAPAGIAVSAGAANPAAVAQSGGQWEVRLDGDRRLDSIAVKAPADWSGTFDITLQGFTPGGRSSDPLTVTVEIAPVVDAPTLQLVAAEARGDEDKPIALGINAAGVDLALVEIAGVPAGAALNNGAVRGALAPDGTYTWSVAGDRAAGLELTPPQDFNGHIFLTVKAIATDGSEQTSVSRSLPVRVDFVVDAPVVSAQAAQGREDTAIPLAISARPTVADDVVDHVVVEGVPAGASLATAAGTLTAQTRGDGSPYWTVSAAELGGLTFTPPPHFKGALNLSVKAVSQGMVAGSGHLQVAESAAALVPVQVDPVADMPDISVDYRGQSQLVGDEGRPVALNLQHRASADPGETLSQLCISGVPAGATFNHPATRAGSDTWLIDPAHAPTLALTPPAGFSGHISLWVRLSSVDSGVDTATDDCMVEIEVHGASSPPTLALQDAATTEDTAVPVSIGAALRDTDGSEKLTVELTVPTGTTFNNFGIGSDNCSWEVRADGTTVFTVDPADLQGLALTPPPHFSGALQVGVKAVAQEQGYKVTATGSAPYDPATTASSFSVAVAPVADQPSRFDVNLTQRPAAPIMDEDTTASWNLDARLADTDGSETLRYVVKGLPAGFAVADGQGNAIAADLNGDFAITQAQAGGLQLTPPADFGGVVNFRIEATITDTASTGSDTAFVAQDVSLRVVPDADRPAVSVAPPKDSLEDASFPMAISAAAQDADGSERVSVILKNVPVGSVLTNAAGGTWTAGVDAREARGYGRVALAEADLKGLVFTPPPHWSGDLDIAVAVEARDFYPGETGGYYDGESLTVPFKTYIVPVADPPALTVQNVKIDEDQTVKLPVQAALVDTDGSEVLSLEVTVPRGATLDNGYTRFTSHDMRANADGSTTYLVAAPQIGSLTFTPPTDYSGDFKVEVKAIASERHGTGANATAATVQTIDVSVAPVVDAAQFKVNVPARSNEDAAFPVHIQTGIQDLDNWQGRGFQSEAVREIRLSGLPAGFCLCNGFGSPLGVIVTPQGDMVLRGHNLQHVMAYGLQIQPPPHWSGQVSFRVEQTIVDTSENRRDTDAAAFGQDVALDIAPVADRPVLQLTAPKSVDEDGKIGLAIKAALVDADGSETLSGVALSGLPQGAALTNAKGDQIAIGADGKITLARDQLKGLALTPPAHWSGTIKLRAEVTATDTAALSGGAAADTATVALDQVIDVVPVVDAPTLSMNMAKVVQGTDQPVAFNLQAALVDADGSETLSIRVEGLPQGATLANAKGDSVTIGADGKTTLAHDQLAGLELTLPKDHSARVQLKVTVTDTDAAASGSDREDFTLAHDLIVRPQGSPELMAYTLNAGLVDIDDAFKWGWLQRPTLSAPQVPLNSDSGATIDLGLSVGYPSSGAQAYPEGLTPQVILTGIPAGFQVAVNGQPLTLIPDPGGTFFAPLSPRQASQVEVLPPADAKGSYQLGVSVYMAGEEVLSDDVALLVTDPYANAPQPTVVTANGMPVLADGWLPDPPPAAIAQDPALLKAYQDVRADFIADALTPMVVLTRVPLAVKVMVDGQPAPGMLNGDGTAMVRLTQAEAAKAEFVLPDNASGSIDLGSVEIRAAGQRLMAHGIGVHHSGPAPAPQPQLGITATSASPYNYSLTSLAWFAGQDHTQSANYQKIRAQFDAEDYWQSLMDGKSYLDVSQIHTGYWHPQVDEIAMVRHQALQELNEQVLDLIDPDIFYGPKGQLNYQIHGDADDYWVAYDNGAVVVTEKADPDNVTRYEGFANVLFDDGVMGLNPAAGTGKVPIDLQTLQSKMSDGRLVIEGVPPGASVTNGVRGPQAADGTYAWSIDVGIEASAAAATAVNLPMGFLGELDLKASAQASASAGVSIGGSATVGDGTLSAQGGAMYSAQASASAQAQATLGALSVGARAGVQAEIKMGVTGSIDFDYRSGLSVEAYAGAIASLTAAAEAEASLGGYLGAGVSGSAGVKVGMEAAGDADVGWSLDKAGVDVSGGAFYGAEAAAEGSYSYDLGPVSVTAGAGVSAGGIGASAGGTLMYDDGKVTFGLSGELAFLIGIEFDFEITIDFNKVIEIAEAVADGVVYVADAIARGVVTAAEAIADGIVTAAEAIAEGFITAGRAIADGFITAGEAIRDGFIAAGEAIRDGFIAVGQAIADGFITAGKAIVDGFITAGKAIADGFITATNAIRDGFIQLGEAIEDGFITIGEAVYSFGAQAVRAVGDFFEDLADDIEDFFDDNCFITTATVRAVGETDDGPTLSALRWFRDEVMMQSRDGRRDVEWYYHNAPAIVDGLARRADRHEVFIGIYDDYLVPAVAAIEAGEHAEARRIYSELVVHSDRLARRAA